MDKEKFKEELEVPFVRVKNESIFKIHRLIKPFILKRVKFNPLQCQSDGFKDILFDPSLVKVDEVPEALKKTLDTAGIACPVERKKICLTYDNFTVEEIFKRVLPQADGRIDTQMNTLSSWSTVGHIIHVNLREHLLPFKFIIGQVLLDKTPSAKMVVNKTSGIDNEFRNFEMEVLAKIPEEVSTVVEETSLSCRFKFDFSKVYWNPRLHTEHERIVERLNRGMDNLYDVFAGVGPFAIPCAKRKCKVLANDLNPHSFKWLQENVKINKVDQFISCFNMDGRDFIRNVVSEDLMSEWKAFDSGEECKVKQFHITMNLPALAIEFLDSFNDWLDKYQEEIKQIKNITLPMIHCYCFVKRKPGCEAENEILSRAESALGCKIDTIDKIFHVRNVAPYKEMYRLSFILPKHLVIKEKFHEHIVKKQKVA